MKTLTTLLIIFLLIGCKAQPPGYKTFRYQKAYYGRCPVYTSVKHYRYVSKHTNPECCNYAPRWKQ